MGLCASQPHWHDSPALQGLFRDSCPADMEEWAYLWDDAFPGGQFVGIYSVAESDEHPKYCFKAVNCSSNFGLHEVNEDGLPDEEHQVVVSPGWKSSSGQVHMSKSGSYEKSTEVQTSGSREITIEGFDHSIDISKAATAERHSGGAMRGGDIQVDGVDVQLNGSAFRFTNNGCTWLEGVKDGTCVAQLQLQHNNFGLQSEPVGFRLLTSLTEEEKQLVMAVCAASAPFLLRGCELTLDTDISISH